MLQEYRIIPALLGLIFLFIFIPAHTIYAETLNTEAMSARSFILMDADSGKVLQSRNLHLELPPASMTKMMTILLALEAIEQGKASLSDQVVASKRACSIGGSTLYLEPGETMSLDDLLKGMALASANDASVAVAEHLAGSEEAFVKRMNQKARELGMKNTCFKNTCGMPAEGHYSSAYDMAVLARYALAHSNITTYSSLLKHSLRDGEFIIYNGNKMLWQYEGVDGLKNGYTGEALNCLTTTAKQGNLRLITVVMGCPYAGHTNDTIALLDFGFEHFDATALIPKRAVMGTVKVKGGTNKTVNIIVSEAVNPIHAKNENWYFSSQKQIPSSVSAPVKKGQKLGKINIICDKKVIKTLDLLAANDVPQTKMASNLSLMPGKLKAMFFMIVILQLGTHRRKILQRK